MSKPITIASTILCDMDVAILNNQGRDPRAGTDNVTIVKKIRKEGWEYPYVSGQAQRYWWRGECYTDGWTPSPLLRKSKDTGAGKGASAYTACDPVEYEDDDIFGYMKASNDASDPKKKGESATRIAPFRNSALISVSSGGIHRQQCTVSRHEGDPLPFEQEVYSNVMKSSFSFYTEDVGTFMGIGKAGYKNVNFDAYYEKHKERLTKLKHRYLKAADGKAVEVLRLSSEERIRRVSTVLTAIHTASGGARSSTNLANIAPAFQIIAAVEGGNNIFMPCVYEDDDERKAELDHEYLDQIIGFYNTKGWLKSKIYIGKIPGFKKEWNGYIADLKEKHKDIIETGIPIVITDSFIKSDDFKKVFT